MVTRQQFLRQATRSTAALAAGYAALARAPFQLPYADAAAPAAKALRPLSIQLEWLKDAEFAGYWIADERGFYKAAGIKPIWISGGPEVLVQATVAANRAQVGILGSTTDLADAIAKGAPLVVIAANYQRSPEGIMSLPDNPVRTAKDLVGKKLALPGGAHREMQAVFKLHHIDPGSVTFVPEGSDPTPLVTHQVDAYYAYAFNEPIALKRKGIKSVFVSMDEFGLPQYGNILIALRSNLETYHDQIVAWLRASIHGWEIDLKNPNPGADAAVDIYGKENNLDRREQRMESAGELPFLTSPLTKQKGLFWMDDAKWEQIARSWKTLGFTGMPDIRRVYTLDLLKEAYQGRRSIG